MADGNRQGVKSASRVLDLFELLGGWGREMSHSEIAAALKIPKSSLSQLLPNLVARGYVEFFPTSKGYRLGARLVALASEASLSKNLKEAVRPILGEITAATKETAALNVLHGDMSEVAASVNSPQRLVSHMRDGDLAPLYATSGGKCILAFLPQPMFDEYLKRVTFEPFTRNTIASAAELRREIDRIRHDGVAYGLAEYTDGIFGMAVAMRAQTGLVLGSINVAMPAVRDSPKARAHVHDVLQNALAQINRQLGLGADDGQKKRRRRAD